MQKFVLIICFFCLAFNVYLKEYKYNLSIFFPPMPVNKENVVTQEGALLGRYLFYDTILSKNYTMSCASCHKQQVAFSDAPQKYSNGFNNEKMKRNTLPLFNLAWYNKLFWDGRVNSIEEQIFEPVSAHNELNITWHEVENRLNNNSFYKKMFKQVFQIKYIDSILTSKAIAQFLRTLISNTSKFDRVLENKDTLSKEELHGFIIMNEQDKGDCLQCHTTDANALATSLEFSNNGLDEVKTTSDFKDKGLGDISKNENDNGKFKIPSLRNIALTPPYMHDGRFNTLEEVLAFYSTGLKKSPTIDSKMEFVHQKGNHLSNEDQKAIIAFLHTLTDSVFISKKEFSNPFNSK